MTTKTVSGFHQADETTRQKAEAVLASLGIPAEVALAMFYRQVVLTGGIPFDVVLPATGTAPVKPGRPKMPPPPEQAGAPTTFGPFSAAQLRSQIDYGIRRLEEEPAFSIAQFDTAIRELLGSRS